MVHSALVLGLEICEKFAKMGLPNWQKHAIIYGEAMIKEGKEMAKEKQFVFSGGRGRRRRG